MKILKSLFSLLLLAVVFSSCESDDPLAKVKYQIVGYDNSITQIKYKAAADITVTLTDANDFGNGKDSKTLDINILPMDAKLEVAANNPTNSVKHYILKIFVQNQEKASYNLDIPSMSSASGSVSYTVPAN